MGFWERLTAIPQPPQYPSAEPGEMAEHLRAFTDKQWGRYAFSREPLEGKFTPEHKDAYTSAACECGAQWAQEILSKFRTRDVQTLAKGLGVSIEYKPVPAGGGQVLFAQFVEPNEITLFTDCLDKAETLGDVLPPRGQLKEIILAHELFHAVEALHSDSIYTRTERVELWRRPFSNRSPIVCLSEIAAMSFAKALLELDYNPYALDVLLVYPYDANAACGLYQEICELTSEVS